DAPTGQACNARLIGERVSGRFLSAAATTLLVPYYSDCEPHVNNFGGALVFDVTNGKLVFLNYLPGYSGHGCIKLPRADGGERLFCNGGFTNQGVTESSIFEAKLTRMPNGEISEDVDIYVRASSTASYDVEVVECADSQAFFGLNDLAP